MEKWVHRERKLTHKNRRKKQNKSFTTPDTQKKKLRRRLREYSDTLGHVDDKPVY